VFQTLSHALCSHRHKKQSSSVSNLFSITLYSRSAFHCWIIFLSRAPSSTHPRVAYSPSSGGENPSNPNPRRVEHIPRLYSNPSLRGIRRPSPSPSPSKTAIHSHHPIVIRIDARARARSRDIFLSKRKTNGKRTTNDGGLRDAYGTTTTMMKKITTGTTTSRVPIVVVVVRVEIVLIINPDGSLLSFPFVSIRHRRVSRGWIEIETESTYLYGESQRPSSRQRVFVRSHRARPFTNERRCDASRTIDSAFVRGGVAFVSHFSSR
jgi:hypothetical protein